MISMNKIWLCALLTLLAGALPCKAGELPWLRAEGKKIVDEAGKPVVLRGFNLGGWLLQEMWMAPFVTKPPEGSQFKEIKDHVTLWRVLEQRFGPEEASRLNVAFRDAWLNESDFKRIHDAGFNSVRLPFIHHLRDEPQGLFFWLDRAVDWAKKHDLYIVLDMHGAPGGQSNNMITGELGTNKLFFDPAMVEETARLWAQIAQRYKDRPEVAGYNLLNEPMGAPNNSTLYLVQDQIYRAIRAVDTRHIIIVEDGYKGFDQMPLPAVVGWQNVVLSIHSYDFNAKDAQAHVRQYENLVTNVTKEQNARGVPFYLGEFIIEPRLVVGAVDLQSGRPARRTLDVGRAL